MICTYLSKNEKKYFLKTIKTFLGKSCTPLLSQPAARTTHTGWVGRQVGSLVSGIGGGEATEKWLVVGLGVNRFGASVSREE